MVCSRRGRAGGTITAGGSWWRRGNAVLRHRSLQYRCRPAGVNRVLAGQAGDRPGIVPRRGWHGHGVPSPGRSLLARAGSAWSATGSAGCCRTFLAPRPTYRDHRVAPDGPDLRACADERRDTAARAERRRGVRSTWRAPVTQRDDVNNQHGPETPTVGSAGVADLLQITVGWPGCSSMPRAPWPSSGWIVAGLTRALCGYESKFLALSRRA